MNPRTQMDGIAALPSVVRNDTVWVGAFEPATRAMGPGLRACVWVRGCPMRCRGCATPEFLEFPEGHSYRSRNYRHLPTPPRPPSQREGGKREQVSPPPTGRGSDLSRPARRERGWGRCTVMEVCAWLDRAIAEHGITGVSFSGGEPFAQANALAAVARYARSRGLSTLSWSGFSRAHLEGSRASDGAQEFLGTLDVLIDGPFVARRANGDSLRGSSNQRIHLLTDRHRPEEFEDSVVEVVIGTDGATVTSGVMEYAATDAILAILGVS